MSMNEEKVCCPRFDPTRWDGRTIEWDNKKFIKDKVYTLFYMPLNYGGAMKRIDEKVERADATVQDGMCLSDHTSQWNMDLYVAVDKEVASAENVTWSGKFLCKVYEGNFKDAGIWMKDFEKFAQGRGISIKKMYLWYTTCPKCAKKYSENYVVIIGQIY